MQIIGDESHMSANQGIGASQTNGTSQMYRLPPSGLWGRGARSFWFFVFLMYVGVLPA